MTGNIRVGHGYDVHRLVAGRPLVLGGVPVPYEKGLLGHSDADVLLHALIDALLGAAALGDIGTLFPDSDPSYQNANSRALLRHVATLLEQAGFVIGNVDTILVAQQPKIAPFVPQMRANIAADLSVPLTAVSVKATTEEGLGFTGSGVGMAAYAVAVLRG